MIRYRNLTIALEIELSFSLSWGKNVFKILEYAKSEAEPFFFIPFSSSSSA